jgi:PAS domain S-box-containing protein
MGEAAGDRDALSRWLAADGLRVLDGLMAHALDVVGVLDAELRVRYLNWTAAGLKREDVLGQSVFALVPPEHYEVTRATYERVLATGVGEHFETIYQAEQGVMFWDVRVGPIRAEGRIIGLLVITSDVTAQRHLHADRDRFFSLSLDLLIVASSTGHLKRLNPAFARALGYQEAELQGTRFMDFVHPDDCAPTQRAFDTVLSGTPVSDFENRYRRKDGELRIFSWRANVDPITRDVYAVARDVTDYRRTEAQLRHAQKMEAVGQLAGGVAHDFNNLLLAILANTDLARDEQNTLKEVREHLQEIEVSARRAADLTRQLLAFSRRQPLHAVTIDLNQLVNSVLRMLRRLLPESINVESIAGHDLSSVSGDRGQLEQVLVNLCVNARDAMEQGGRLTIETENVLINQSFVDSHPWAKPGRYVLLSVTDTGTGMSAEVKERAFEPFFTTKALHQGTGLGLATVYGIVQQHGGVVYLYSEPGQGTSVKVYLPAAARVVTQPNDKIEALPPRGDETILIAEDEELVRRAVVQLVQRAGYRTIAVATGAEALRIVRDTSEPIHLALLDVVMPDLGGPETAERLRSLCPGLRILFASGYADRRYLERLPRGAQVLAKPFRTDELLRRIRETLDQT